LAQIPPIVAGGGLLGVLTARWLRFPGAVLVTFVVFGLGGIAGYASRDMDPVTWWLWWSSVRDGDEPFTYGSRELAANPWLHAVYLVGLCTCATVAAVYRDRWPRLVAVGLPVAVVAVVFGFLQQP
jgi:hypothetical protein